MLIDYPRGIAFCPMLLPEPDGQGMGAGWNLGEE
jgi:hypothetical protein